MMSITSIYVNDYPCKKTISRKNPRLEEIAFINKMCLIRMSPLSSTFTSDSFDSSYTMYNLPKHSTVNFLARGSLPLRGLSKKRAIKDESSYWIRERPLCMNIPMNDWIYSLSQRCLIGVSVYCHVHLKQYD